MANNKGKMIRLGVFVTLGVALFTFSVYYLGKSQNLFGNTFTIYSDFKNVNGLQPGNNVRFSGINVGSVQQIDILNDSTLRVKMNLQKRVKEYIKKDAIASIGTDGLVGSALVNINPGPGKLPPVEDNDVVQTYSKLETDEMLQSLGTTSENIALLSLNLLEVAEKFNTGEGLFGVLLNDERLVRDVERSIQNIKNTSNNLDLMSAQLNESISKTQDGEGLLGFLLTDSTLAPQVENIVTRVDTVIKNQAEPIFADLKKSVEEINAFSSELKQVVEDINSGKGTVGTFLKDEATDQQIQDILYNLNESSIKLNENLLALRSNWFFRRYFKKKAKQEKKEAGKAKEGENLKKKDDLSASH